MKPLSAPRIPNKKATGDSKTKRSNIGVFLASWSLALIFGVVLFSSSITITGILLSSNDPDIAPSDHATVFVFLMLLSIVISWLILQTLQKRLFYRYFQYALIFGAGLSVCVGMMMAAAPSDYKDIRTSTCPGLEYMSNLALSNTYAIQTNLGIGSGFLVNPTTIITNAHVVQEASYINTWINGQEVPLKIEQMNTDFDLAALSVTYQDSESLPLTNDYQQKDEVYAIGFPGNTFSGGIVSISKGIVSRPVDSLYNPDLGDIILIQTDAAINPGNSGGPLVNKCGVIGMNSAISTSNILSGLPREEGISYAISSRNISEVLGIPVR